MQTDTTRQCVANDGLQNPPLNNVLIYRHLVKHSQKLLKLELLELFFPSLIDV